MGNHWMTWAERVLEGGTLTRAEALAVLGASPDDLPEALAAAFRVRRAHSGRRVNLHVIRNARSGSCSENCSFCSQSAVAGTDIPHYPLQSAEELVAGAREAARIGAVKYCIVTSGRGPMERDLAIVCETAQRIHAEGLRLHICVSLGIATAEQLQRLAAAGVQRYNHNLETSRRFFPSICKTHAYDDRVRTVRLAKAAGLEVCCGGIMGLGETPEDRADLAFALRDLQADSIPVNFFNPRPGTPLAGTTPLAALDALRALILFRLVNPTADIRAAGGREACLGPLQPLALYTADSIFTEGYLTTPGQGQHRDLDMIARMGFEIGRIEA